MEKLKAKLKKQGGFTLVEMLIVVAIIAILVAVSIPVMGSAVNDAKKTVDNANLRAAKGVVVTAYLASISSGNVSVTLPDGVTFSTGTPYIYDAEKGCLSTSAVATGYSAVTEGNVIAIGVKSDGEVVSDWVTAGTAPASAGLSFS